MPEVPISGTKEEQKQFTDVLRHYQMARQDLEQRIISFDKVDILFRSHIEESKWPYRSMVFDPRTFTALFEKTSRILANKPKGRLVPREGGDAISARINNELLDFQWDDNERVDSMPMIAKWQLMDMNARKYGSSFALTKWHYEPGCFDGPNFKPLNNRDCLPNPSYSTIKHWFQHRDYVTLDELEKTNDAAKTKPIYKNLKTLRDMVRRDTKKGGDTRASNYTIKNLSIKGLTDFLGQDEVFKTIEIVTEYRKDRWITFSPKHGVIIRDIPNPYKHGQIPVIMLRYYPIDDDLYGLSEIEPVEKIQRAINAVVCQYLDAINMSLYAPLKVRQTGGSVQMHTLEFGPGKKWLMNDPSSDVLTHDQNISGVSEFTSTYRFLVSAMQEALGETSQGISNLNPGEGGKTATEVRDLASSRKSRDNYNQIFLSEALKKQMILWLQMNQQFIFSDPREHIKAIRIGSKDAIQYFQRQGLDAEGLDEMGTQAMITAAEEGIQVDPLELNQPLYPVDVNGVRKPKFEMDGDGQMGTLYMEKEDQSGVYDYIPDVVSMQIPDDAQILAATKQTIELALNPVTGQMLMAEGYRVKFKDLLEDFLEQLGKKDADKYFEKLQPGGFNDPTGQLALQGGAAGTQPGQQDMVNGGNGGMAAGAGAMAQGQAQPIVS